MLRTFATLMLVMSLSGCAMRNWLFPPAPFSDRAPCAISPTINKNQLIAHINANIQGSATSSGLASWRSTNVKITATGMPPGFSAPASIAVEAPRNFRLRVSEPLTRAEALDMGSNHGEFWFWAKDARPGQVITVSHENMPAVQRELQVPFHPDWLMEVLGVIPIDGSKYTLKRSRTDAPTLELITESLNTAGTKTKKVIRIDACHGIIREHALYDGQGILVARAALADHRRDQATGLIMPHIVSFDWPSMKQSMKMVLGGVDLNPSKMPAEAWQVPHKPDAPRIDLSQMLGGRLPGHPAMYGAGSPFGIVPPQEDGGFEDSEHVEQAGHVEFDSAENVDSQFGDAAVVPASHKETAWWDEAPGSSGGEAEVQLHDESIRRASREHLTRRPAPVH